MSVEEGACNPIVPLPLYRQGSLSGRQQAAVRALFSDTPDGKEVSGTTGPDQSPQDVALSAVITTLRRFGEDARRRVERLLFRRATRIANRFAASAAWLFIPEGEGFRAVFAHKNRHRDEFLRASEPSFIAHVFKRGAPDVAPVLPDPKRFPFFRLTLSDTRSAIATPIWSPEDENREILGVFHLESANVEEYGEKDLNTLDEAADDLAGLLLVLKALECGDDRWFPWLDSRFDLSQPLWEILDEIRKAIDPTGVQCTIWAADHRQRGGLFVYATTGQDEEFESKKTLPLESYSGALAASPPGAVGVASPDGKTQIIVPILGDVEIRPDHPPFRDERPGFFLKWIGSLGAPIHAWPPHGTEPVTCTFTISCFEGVEESRLPSHDELTQVVQEIGNFITGFLHLREKLAVYHLRRALRLCRSQRRAWTIEKEFRAIAQKFTEFLGLEAITIVARLAPNHEFQLITKDGRTEALLVDDPYRSVHKEITDKDEEGEVIGRIHMSRCRPFSVSDKELIHRLTAQTSVIDAFLRWRKEVVDLVGNNDGSQISAPCLD